MKHQFTNDLLIIKVGTNVLAEISETKEQLRLEAFESIGRQIQRLSESGKHIILVTSGAITAGVLADGKKRQAICDTAMEQRYAARGWDIVVQHWKAAIGETKVSSTLLTKREIHSDSMNSKLIQALECCLKCGDVFVVNENDCLSDDEIKFGDNDTLAAALAKMCAKSGLFKKVKLLLLTNKNGLNKIADDDNTIIRRVTDISAVEQFAGGASNGHSRGGMKTKILAAKTATNAGVETFIANGHIGDVIACALDKRTGTYFCVAEKDS